MHGDWITSSTGRHILAHWADPRPAWLWSRDGEVLLWRNPAARFVRARLKKNGLRLAAEAVPIRGQVQRLIRLGRVGQSSLSRVQFLVGEKPMALTCTCMPVDLATGEHGLLLVGNEKIDKDVREAAADLGPDRLTEALIPPDVDYLLVVDGLVRAGSSGALAAEAPVLMHQGLPTESGRVAVIAAGPKGQTLLLYRSKLVEAAAPAVTASGQSAAREPELPLGLAPLAEPPAESDAGALSADAMAEEAGADAAALSSLFDRLAGDAQLFTGLSAADEVFAGPPPALPAPVSAADLAANEQFLPEAIASYPLADATASHGANEGVLTTGEPDLADMPEMMLAVEAAEATMVNAPPEDLAHSATPAGIAAHVVETAAVIAAKDNAVEDVAPSEPPKSHWLITGRGFRAAESATPPDSPPATESLSLPLSADADITPDTIDATADADTVERVTRYNFEELGRILTDRVAGDGREPAPQPARQGDGVVSLTAETLVLNRLQLAILVFRDQQILFANRALTDLLAYDSVDALRQSGIAAIFPSAEESASGPVNQLVRRDGTLLPVSARLQSVSWQGRPALMLSAQTTEMSRGYEGAVRAFAAQSAEVAGDGFLAADRAGIITEASSATAAAVGLASGDLIGKPLAILVSAADLDPLRAFLEKPARFAETARPHIRLTTEDGGAQVILFAEGQAGTISGYFGLLRLKTRSTSTTPSTPPPAAPPEVAGLLSRLSRGLRRPLNTIIGFADLIRTADAGTTGRDRYVEYAEDIRTAGLEITVLADELDDYTRLSDASTAPRHAEIDLQALLDNCALRVKGLAGAGRVLVRTAIAERLPLIRADRASLSQALLNLLASAIDTTPVGGSVILSAQFDDDGNIAIHVRDGAQSLTDIAERFVVFRDGVDRQGVPLDPVRSAMGLTLTRSLLSVNDCTLSIDPTAGVGTLFTLSIPASLIVRHAG